MSINNLRKLKYKTFGLTGVWADTLGEPERSGAWLIYGPEKNGKTWFALLLAELLSSYEKVLYVSGEEAFDKTFVEACNRARVEESKRLIFAKYTPIPELQAYLNKQRSPKIVILDNLTVYLDELKGSGLNKLLQDHPTVLFIFLAHEERNEPYGAAARLARKLAKIIFKVKGLKAFVGARCPGGTLLIDETSGKLYHGTDEN